MKSKTPNTKKISSLSIVFLLVGLYNCLNSQIIYTDITDATPNATYQLDLNNDTISDFVLYYSQAFKVVCKPLNKNAYSGNFANGIYSPWALSSSSIICDSLMTWYDSSKEGTMAGGNTVGHWVGASNKYLALKLVVGTNIYYGWARLDILFSSGSFTVKDYAYQSTPKACIQAGQTKLDIQDAFDKPVFSIFPNPLTSSTKIETSSYLKNASLTIFNSLGRVVKEENNISGHSIALSPDGLTDGLYFIQLSEDNINFKLEKLIVINSP